MRRPALFLRPRLCATEQCATRTTSVALVSAPREAGVDQYPSRSSAWLMSGSIRKTQVRPTPATATPRSCCANGPTRGSADSSIWARTSTPRASTRVTRTACSRSRSRYLKRPAPVRSRSAAAVAGRSTSAARTPKPALDTSFDQTGSSASRADTRAGRAWGLLVSRPRSRHSCRRRGRRVTCHSRHGCHSRARRQ